MTRPKIKDLLTRIKELEEKLMEKDEKIEELAKGVIEADKDYITQKRLIGKLKEVILFYEKKAALLGQNVTPVTDPLYPAKKKAKQKAEQPLTQTNETEAIKIIRANCKKENLELKLKEKIKGQDHIVELLRKVLRGHFSPISEKRPTTLIFTGPTGVGKTYTAEILNEVLFEGLKTKPSLLTIFGGDFSAEHEVSKLIGSPPGYVGHDEEGALVKHIRTSPEHSVILFDEIEKAHPNIYDYLLMMMDKGVVMGNREGQVYDCSKYIIIMTSNIGEMESSTAKPPIGIVVDYKAALQEKRDTIIAKAIKGHFKPEFVNRVRALAHFNYLTEENTVEILDKEIREMNKRGLKADTFVGKISLTERAREQILKEGFSREFGARELKRTLAQYTIENDEFLDIVEDGDDIAIDFDKEFIYNRE